MVKHFGLVWMHEACGTSKMDGKVLWFYDLVWTHEACGTSKINGKAIRG